MCCLGLGLCVSADCSPSSVLSFLEDSKQGRQKIDESAGAPEANNHIPPKDRKSQGGQHRPSSHQEGFQMTESCLTAQARRRFRGLSRMGGSRCYSKKLQRPHAKWGFAERIGHLLAVLSSRLIPFRPPW